MKLAIDDTDTADGNICVVTGAKDHYVKVSPSCCCITMCCVEWQILGSMMLDHSLSFTH